MDLTYDEIVAKLMQLRDSNASNEEMEEAYAKLGGGGKKVGGSIPVAESPKPENFPYDFMPESKVSFRTPAFVEAALNLAKKRSLAEISDRLENIDRDRAHCPPDYYLLLHRAKKLHLEEARKARLEANKIEKGVIADAPEATGAHLSPVVEEKSRHQEPELRRVIPAVKPKKAIGARESASKSHVHSLSVTPPKNNPQWNLLVADLRQKTPGDIENRLAMKLKVKDPRLERSMYVQALRYVDMENKAREGKDADPPKRGGRG